MLVACGKPDKPTINLYRAVHADDIDQIERNLFWGANVNLAGPDGNYPIHVAVQRGNRAIVQMLLRSSAHIDSLNNEEMTPLQTAIMHGRVQTAELLIEHNATFSPNKLLHEVASHGIEYKDIINLLLKNGAELESSDQSGNRPLHNAIIGNHRVLVRQLLTRGADVEATNSVGSSPLDLAEKSGNHTIIKLLKQYGAN
jgi:ankyrin repeat protein